MKVSTIIVNYNGRDFIRECVDSVLKSDYPNFEAVIVDNASTDGSYELLKEHYGENKKVKIVRSDKQLYFTGGSNLGAKKAAGEKLIFLNSDTVVTKNFIKELVNFSKEHKNYLVQPKILFYDPKNVIDNVGGRCNFFGFGYAIGRGKKDKGQYDKNFPVDYTNGTCFLIERNFFWKIGGFDERFKYFYEDVDLSWRAKKRGGECWYCHKSHIYHKGSLTFKRHVIDSRQRFFILRNRLLILFKNEPRSNFLLKLPFVVIISLVIFAKDLMQKFIKARLDT